MTANSEKKDSIDMEDQCQGSRCFARICLVESNGCSSHPSRTKGRPTDLLLILVCHSNAIAAMLCQTEAGAECRYWIRITGKWPERSIGRGIRDSINGFLAV